MSKLTTMVSFNGRMPRRQFWGEFLLSSFMAPIALFAIALMFGSDSQSIGYGYIFVGFVVLILIMVVIVATMVKRFHDRDKSGLWVLISLTGIGLLWIKLDNLTIRLTSFFFCI